MIRSLKILSEKIRAEYIGEDVSITGAHINSQEIKPGELFIAIKDRRDGHRFIDDAVKNGAKAVIVSERQKNLPITQIVVKDTRKALFDLALSHREHFDMPVLAVTGSCGKTTTKEMLLSILSDFGKAFASPGNFNNALGVPLTILSAPTDCHYLILEAGTNSPGEIAHLAKLIRADIAGITNVSASHLEKLLSLDGVMTEKGALLSSLKQNGIAIINRDDRRINNYAQSLSCRCIDFSLSDKTADIYLKSHCANDTGFNYSIEIKGRTYENTLNLPGLHNLQNALMALSYVYAIGLDPDQAMLALSRFQAYQGRFSLKKLTPEVSLIDDTYNASVKSVEAAINTLSQFEGRKVLVLGNMGELGASEDDYHRQVGKWIEEAKIDHIYLYGNRQLMQHVLNQVTTGASYIETKTEIIKAIKALLAQQEPTLIVIKGARANKMEEIIKALSKHSQNSD